MPPKPIGTSVNPVASDAPKPFDLLKEEPSKAVATVVRPKPVVGTRLGLPPDEETKDDESSSGDSGFESGPTASTFLMAQDQRKTGRRAAKTGRRGAAREKRASDRSRTSDDEDSVRRGRASAKRESRSSQGTRRERRSRKQTGFPSDDDQIDRSSSATSPTLVSTKEIQKPKLHAGSKTGAATPRTKQTGPSDAEHSLVLDCFLHWAAEPDDRVTPPPAAVDQFLLVILTDEGLLQRRARVDRLLRRRDPWLNRLDAIRFGNPTTDRAPLHEIDLTGLPPPEQVAVLQSVLYDAGYSFKNLVPTFEQRQGWVRHVVPEQLHIQISSIIRAAKDVEDRFKEIQKVVKRETSAKPAKSKSSGEGLVSARTLKASRPVIDPTKYRKPVSIPSTSDWESDEAPSDEEDTRGEETAPTGLEGDVFLRQTSLGPNLASKTGSHRLVGPPLAARPVHQPPPSEFDEPMELAPAFQSQGVGGTTNRFPPRHKSFPCRRPVLEGASSQQQRQQRSKPVRRSAPCLQPVMWLPKLARSYLTGMSTSSTGMSRSTTGASGGRSSSMPPVLACGPIKRNAVI
jgi:hypothetical protein